MYQEISKLIMYGNMDQDCILYKFADIFRRFEMQESSDAQLTQDIYTQIKRLLEVATDYGFDKNLWHNYLTFILITMRIRSALPVKRLVQMTAVSMHLQKMIFRCL